MKEEQIIDALIQKSRVAQRKFSVFKQKEVDAIVKAIGKTVYSRAEELAKMAMEESGMGDYNDKIAKCIGKSSNGGHRASARKTIERDRAEEGRRQ